MHRRDVLKTGLSAVAAAALPLSGAAWAQAVPLRKPVRVGWLKIQDKSDTPGWIRELRARLGRLGQVEGSSYVLVERYADGDASRLAALTDDLLVTGVDIIVATSQPAVDAARKRTRTVPIIGRMTDDPVTAGAAASLPRPGGNVTGVYTLLEETSAKRLSLLHEAIPSIRRVGALLTLNRGATARWLAETEAVAKSLGIAMQVLDVHKADELPGLFDAAVANGVDGILAFRNPTVVTYSKTVIALANARRLPTMFEARDYVLDGALISYGPNIDVIFHRIAILVDKVAKGERVGDIPIEQPTELELVVNLKTAKALGVTLPASISLQASDLVE